MVRPFVRAGFAALALSTAGFATVALPPLPAASQQAAARQGESQDRRAEVERVRQYLNSIKSLQADFRQESGRKTSTGKLWVERPGKVRFEYDPPVPILIVSSGDDLAHYDKMLDSVNYIPQSRTPAWFLLAPEVKLDGRVSVTDVQRSGDELAITFVQSDRPDEGALTIFLRDKPMELRGWRIEDVGSGATTVTLTNVQTGVYIPERLFNFTPGRPRGGN